MIKNQETYRKILKQTKDLEKTSGILKNDAKKLGDEAENKLKNLHKGRKIIKDHVKMIADAIEGKVAKGIKNFQEYKIKEESDALVGVSLILFLYCFFDVISEFF